MGLRLGSQELVDAILKRQDEDPAFRKVFHGLSLNVLFVATDGPGNVDRQYHITIQNGKFTNVKVDIQPAPSKLRDPDFDKTKFDYKAIGDHKLFFDLLQGRMDLIQWIPKVRLEGDFGKPISQLAALGKLLDVLSKMDLEP
jgi:hypothetical protein